MSGHSKWSTIKRKKGAADAKRGQIFTKLAREITVAARQGVPDPEFNFRLRLAVQKARAENMPKENIDRAIERGHGGGDGGANFEEVYYEGYGPGGTALMIQAQTDNRNRTVGEIRAVLTRSGGTLGESGSVGWMFDQVGLISLATGDTDPDEVQLVAIDAGADDVQVEDGAVEVYTQPQDLHRIQEALASAGYGIENAELTMRPKTQMEADSETAVKALRLLEKLEDLDDVQQVYTNLQITEQVLAEVG
jgi:YebC/PmpR family DNA-binding regulatory protein